MVPDATHVDVDWAALLAAARSGDGTAIGEVCTLLQNYLLLAAEQRLGRDIQPKVAASDIVQLSLLEAHQEFSSFRGSSEAEVRIWLIRILEHNLIDSTRQFRGTQQRDVSREMPLGIGESRPDIAGPHRTASSILRRRETDEEMYRAVAQLPDRRRQVVELRHRDGRSYAEIGRELGISEVTARKLWSRAVEQLRSKLTSHHVEC